MMQGPSGVCPVLELDVERSHAHQQAGHEQQPPLVRADANKVRKPHEVAEGVDCNCCEQLASSEEDVTHKSTKERRVVKEDPFFCDGGEDVVADLLQLLLGLPEV
eukprot:CAMPEP_0206218260 /NCGR_PEP_ID=MMETSP0047_2-20121206/3705_1 /ASSEMBLY_ACC=CAM_ASM_000192 /TAXON_ID=195065 /ORGANISM="Chroomonas mesostigmatica_cf, Strain CCMP1168" /LENGTH=104 /DNA_ID=CAMNT_0053640753 /DNA_START=12 /DNA_END=327 /DNA_ORIENTATION=+